MPHENTRKSNVRGLDIDGALVYRLRKMKAWTQEELAARADISLSTIKSVERNTQRFSSDVIKLIAKAFGSPYEEEPELLLRNISPGLMDDGTATEADEWRPASGKTGRLYVTLKNADIKRFQKIVELRSILESMIAFAGLEDDLQVITLTKGSVVIELEMDERDCERLLAAYREGKLEPLGITDVSDVPPPAVVAARARARRRRAVRRVLKIAAAPGHALFTLVIAGWRLLLRAMRSGGDGASTAKEVSEPLPRRPRWSIEPGAWDPRAIRLSLIEVLVGYAVIAVGILILVPAIVNQREAARRARCANNLKQLGLAVANYEGDCGYYPSGSYSGTLFNPPHLEGHPENFSCFVRMLPWLDQAATYNAVNFNLTSADPANITVAGIQVGALLCPNDSRNIEIDLPAPPSSNGLTPGWAFNRLDPMPPGQWRQAFTSYAGNAGTFTFGYSKLMHEVIRSNYDGVIYNDSRIRVMFITDGLSHTFLFGERSKGLAFETDAAHAVSDNAWDSGLWHDTLYSTLYPLNAGLGEKWKIRAGGRYQTSAAGSYHLGGAFFAFCDGSVHFIRETIDSWPFRAGNSDGAGNPLPDGTNIIRVAPRPPYTQPGSYLSRQDAGLGIYQKLSTRSGSETIGPDSY